MEEFKKIIALSFIEAYKKNPLVTSKTALSKKISEEITEKEKGEPDDKHYKSLLNYYDYFFNHGKKQEPTETMINKLLGFLNYESIDHFIKNQPFNDNYWKEVPFISKPTVKPENELDNKIIRRTVSYPPPDFRLIFNKIRIVIIISITVISFALFYFGIDWSEKDCMIWKEDRYKAAVCYENSNLKYEPRNDEVIKEFRKIEVDTNDIFFKENGDPKVWYKKIKGEIEYFNNRGVHPKYGDSLKPITETIVRKYVYREK